MHNEIATSLKGGKGNFIFLPGEINVFCVYKTETRAYVSDRAVHFIHFW